MKGHKREVFEHGHSGEYSNGVVSVGKIARLLDFTGNASLLKMCLLKISWQRLVGVARNLLEVVSAR